MNKTDLINAIAEEAQITKADSKKALTGFINAVTASLKKGEEVSILGFGKFSVKETAARTGRNPRTKEPITIPAKKSVKFKAGAELEIK